MLLLSASAYAQNRPPRFEAFAEGGGSFLNGGSGLLAIPCPAPPIPCLGGVYTSSFSKTGRLIAGARLRFTRHDALEASYSFSPNHFSFVSATGVSGDAYNRVNLVSFNYVRYLWAKTPVQPFLTGGVGFNRFSGPSSASAVVEGLVSASNGLQFAWNFGGGSDIVLQRHIALRLELRDYVTGQPSFIAGTSHNIVPSAGIVFRLK
jgi:hypothetical protein